MYTYIALIELLLRPLTSRINKVTKLKSFWQNISFLRELRVMSNSINCRILWMMKYSSLHSNRSFFYDFHKICCLTSWQFFNTFYQLLLKFWIFGVLLKVNYEIPTKIFSLSGYQFLLTSDIGGGCLMFCHYVHRTVFFFRTDTRD